MFALLYKDFVLTKRYVLLMLAVCVAIPLLMRHSFGDSSFTGTLLLLICSVYMSYMCLMDLARKENEYHSAVALVGAASYSRMAMVLSTYVYALLLIAAAGLIFAVEALFVPQLRSISPAAAGAVFFVVSVLVGVLLPLIYAFGFDKIRLVFTAVPVGIVFLPTLAAKLSQSGTLPLPQIGEAALAVLLWGAGSLVLALSALLSVRIFSRTELA